MRIAALTVPALLLLTGGCAMFGSNEESPFAQPNTLMADEINTRVAQIPFQHRDELLQNLLWLSQTGETTITALLEGLKSDNPKMRSSCVWVLGRIHDRRTIPYLQPLTKDSNETVRLEAARSLVALGDFQQAPMLIEGLDDPRKEVRYLCHEALKAAAGRDFGFDHLGDNDRQHRMTVLGWRQWWSDYSGDPKFAESYREKYHLNAAAPMAEVQPQNKQQQDAVDPNATQQVDPSVDNNQGHTASSEVVDTSEQSSGNNQQTPVTNQQSQVAPVTNPQTPVTNHESQVAPVRNPQTPVTNQQTPVTNQRTPVTPVPNQQTPVPNHQAPVSPVIDPSGNPVPLPPGVAPQRSTGSGNSTGG